MGQKKVLLILLSYIAFSTKTKCAMKKSDLQNIVAAEGGYIAINKAMSYLLGMATAAYWAALLNQARFVADGVGATPSVFSYSQGDCEQETGLSAHQQTKALKQLAALGLVKVAKRGHPAQNYYTIGPNQLELAQKFLFVAGLAHKQGGHGKEEKAAVTKIFGHQSLNFLGTSDQIFQPLVTKFFRHYIVYTITKLFNKQEKGPPSSQKENPEQETPNKIQDLGAGSYMGLDSEVIEKANQLEAYLASLLEIEPDPKAAQIWAKAPELQDWDLERLKAVVKYKFDDWGQSPKMITNLKARTLSKKLTQYEADQKLSAKAGRKSGPKSGSSNTNSEKLLGVAASAAAFAQNGDWGED